MSCFHPMNLRACRLASWRALAASLAAPRRPSRGAFLVVVATIVVPAVLNPSGGLDAQSDSAASREATLLFNTASRFYRQERWTDAAASFGELLRRFPEHADVAEARFARGYSLSRLGSFEEAARELAEARKSRGVSWEADAHFHFGRAKEELSRAASGETARSLLLDAADGFSSAASLRRAALKKALADEGDEATIASLSETYVESLAAAGEALYGAGDVARAETTLAGLLAEGPRFESAAAYPRGVYFLALARYAADSSRAKSAPTDFDRTLATLAVLVDPRREREPLFRDAAFLGARLEQARGRLSEAIGLHERIIAIFGDRAVEERYWLGLARYDRGAAADLPGARESLDRALALGLRAPLDDRARFYAALASFRAGDFDDASRRLDALLLRESSESSLAELLDSARLSAGQATLLRSRPDPSRALELLQPVIERRRRDGDRSGLAEALYWDAEARLALAGDELPAAARGFEEVAGPLRDVAGRLAEESAHKAALAWHRAGEFARCARTSASYRDTYGQDGRFLFESLQLSAENAFRAPDGALSDEERALAATHYLAAAALAKDAASRRSLRYLAGLAFHSRGKIAESVKTLRSVREEIAGAVDESLAQIDYYLADGLAKLAEEAVSSTDDDASRALAAALFLEAAESYERYLATRPATDESSVRLRVDQGIAFEKANRPREARERLRMFSRSGANRGDLAARVLWRIASLSRALGETEQARDELLAVARTPDVDPALAARALVEGARLARTLGDPALAAKSFHSAIAAWNRVGGREAAREALDVSLELAVTLRESGRETEAAAQLDRLLADSARGSSREAEIRIERAYLHVRSLGREPGSPQGGDRSRDPGDPEVERAARAVLELLAPIVESAPPSDDASTWWEEAQYLAAWAHRRLASLQDLDETAARAERDRAIELLRRLLAKSPGCARSLDARLELAELLFDRGAANGGRPGESQRDADEASVLFETLRAELIGAGRPANETEAGDTVRRASLLERARYGLATVRYREARFDDARKLFDEVASVEASALAPAALFYSARARVELRAEGEAASRFERLVGDWKDRSGSLREESLLRLGECYLRTGEPARSELVLRRLLEESPETRFRFDALCTLGIALQRQDRLDPAVQVFREVVSSSSGSVAARSQYHIGECRMDQGRHREAARELLTVVANFRPEGAFAPWVRRAQLAAGIAYAEAGDPGAARKELEELIRTAPESEEAGAARARLEIVPKD